MLFIRNLLVFILMFPIFGILLLLFVPSNKKKLLKSVALNIACSSFIVSLLLLGFFQKSIGCFQFFVKFFWLPSLNFNFLIGIDGISLFFVLLTNLLIPLVRRGRVNSVIYVL